jgi:two-component system, LytTR family, response regulator
MNAIIIDDEVSCIESLLAKIELFTPSIKVIKTYILPQEALNDIPKMDLDVIFLDVEMPNINGITFAQKAKLVNTEIIYTTAYQQYAVDAFRVCAFDFLLKPVDRKELVESVEKLNQKLQEKHLKRSKLQAKYNKITVHTPKGLQFVAIQNILWIESDNSYTKLYLEEGKPIVTSRSIGDFEEMLAEYDFCRIHHSVIVNLQHIQEYVKGDGGSVILSNGHELDVSRRRKADLMALIGA